MATSHPSNMNLAVDLRRVKEKEIVVRPKSAW